MQRNLPEDSTEIRTRNAVQAGKVPSADTRYAEEPVPDPVEIQYRLQKTEPYLNRSRTRTQTVRRAKNEIGRRIFGGEGADERAKGRNADTEKRLLTRSLVLLLILCDPAMKMTCFGRGFFGRSERSERMNSRSFCIAVSPRKPEIIVRRCSMVSRARVPRNCSGVCTTRCTIIHCKT